jgi:hypothetical protein
MIDVYVNVNHSNLGFFVERICPEILEKSGWPKVKPLDRGAAALYQTLKNYL